MLIITVEAGARAVAALHLGLAPSKGCRSGSHSATLVFYHIDFIANYQAENVKN
jgi:hypothetical protein